MKKKKANNYQTQQIVMKVLLKLQNIFEHVTSINYMIGFEIEFVFLVFHKDEETAFKS